MSKPEITILIPSLSQSTDSFKELVSTLLLSLYKVRPHTGFVTKWIKSYCSVSARLKCQFLMFISILVFRPEGQIWNPVRRDTKIYVRRILNAFRINKTQLNSSTISPSYKENVRFSTVDFHKLKWSRK